MAHHGGHAATPVVDTGVDSAYVPFGDLLRDDFEALPFMDGWTMFTYFNLIPTVLHLLIHLGGASINGVTGIITDMSDGSFKKEEIESWPVYYRRILQFWFTAVCIPSDLVLLVLLLSGWMAAKQIVFLLLPVHHGLLFLTQFTYPWTGEYPKSLLQMPFPVCYVFIAFWAIGFILDGELHEQVMSGGEERFFAKGFYNYAAEGRSPFPGFDEVRIFVGCSLVFLYVLFTVMYWLIPGAASHWWGVSWSGCPDKAIALMGHVQSIVIGAISIFMTLGYGLLILYGGNFALTLMCMGVIVFWKMLTVFNTVAYLRPAIKADSKGYGGLLR